MGLPCSGQGYTQEHTVAQAIADEIYKTRRHKFGWVGKWGWILGESKKNEYNEIFLDEEKKSLYVLGLWLNGFDMFTGILNTVAMIGPIIGFIMSSVFARLYVDIGYVDLSK